MHPHKLEMFQPEQLNESVSLTYRDEREKERNWRKTKDKVLEFLVRFAISRSLSCHTTSHCSELQSVQLLCWGLINTDCIKGPAVTQIISFLSEHT